MIEDEEPLQKRSKWTRQDKLLLTLNILMHFGDQIEVYLPSVITQQVSCELRLSSTQEGMITTVFYVTLAGGILFAAFLSHRISLRKIILISMYCSILATVVCAAVANYFTLVLSRGLIGFCVGLNSAVGRVYFTQNASSSDIHAVSMFLIPFIGDLGSCFVALEAWLLLDLVGWRVFSLLVSMPFFLMPIILLHCCKLSDNESSVKYESDVGDESNVGDEASKEIIVPNLRWRILQLSLVEFMFTLIAYGGIILLPSMIRMNNYRSSSDLTLDKCKFVLHGSQFLIIAAVNGCAFLVGKPLGYWLKGRLPFQVLQCSYVTLIVLAYGFLLFYNGVLATAICIGMSKFAYALQSVEIGITAFDPHFFGTRDLATASAIAYGSAYAGAAVGTGIVSFSDQRIPVMTKVVLGVVEFFVLCLIPIRKINDLTEK